MPDAGKQNSIDAAAAVWFARMDRGEADPDVSAAFERWLAADVRHQGAYARLCAIQAAMTEESEGRTELAPAPVHSRRRLLWGGGMAAGLAGLGLVGVGWVSGSGTAYASGLGEVRIVQLEDGSSITLNTQSRVRVWLDDHRRRAELEAGEAIFNIAHRSGLPFDIKAGATQIETSAGSVAVRRFDEMSTVSLLVQEGSASIRSEGGATRALGDGALARTDGSGRLDVSVVDAEDLARRMAWREGMIAFEGESLQVAVAEFARYSAVPIIIADPALEQRTITGLFAADDPAGFARTVAMSFGVRARINPDAIRLG